MTRITVNVGFREGYYVSEANHAITKSRSALSLKMLRKRIMVVALQRRKAGEEVALTLLLNSAAQREWDRRQGAVGL
jgi:hypothetical protein